MSSAAFVGVRQTFGDFTALDGLDLTIEEGRLTTLLGPSGCGKTTSLRILAGYVSPTAGQVLIGGQDATRLPPERRNLGMVFQSYALFPHLTVEDNVGFGLKLRKVDARRRREKVMSALELVGLGHLAKRKPKALSGGQQQRVALARAIAIDPALLLLDEPLSNLDARLRVQMRAEIRRIQGETGLTVVLVTHDQDEALEMSDRMVVMRSGRIEQADTPEAVFTAPANRFVAEFMGYENFIRTASGETVTVRPEHLLLQDASTPAGTDADLSLDATVVDTAYRGVDVLTTLAATGPGGDAVTLHASTRQMTGAHAGQVPAPGASVRVAARAHDLVTLPE